jgi:uncharacterized protein YdeI (YjbR/CyaY-like superfamily)
MEEARVGADDRRAVNAKVDAYIKRSTKWPREIERLRPILLGSGLTEELKWGKPCYSSDGKNIVIVQEMKDFLSLMFFKGALMNDPAEVLDEQGPNSHSAKRITFTSVEQVSELAGVVKAYIKEAIDLEDLGVKAAPSPPLVLVEELQQRLKSDRALKKAFEALTPGRQREYNLYFSDAKQATTRQGRIDKFAPRILEGKGMRE